MHHAPPTLASRQQPRQCARAFPRAAACNSKWGMKYRRWRDTWDPKLASCPLSACRLDSRTLEPVHDRAPALRAGQRARGGGNPPGVSPGTCRSRCGASPDLGRVCKARATRAHSATSTRRLACPGERAVPYNLQPQGRGTLPPIPGTQGPAPTPVGRCSPAPSRAGPQRPSPGARMSIWGTAQGTKTLTAATSASSLAPGGAQMGLGACEPAGTAKYPLNDLVALASGAAYQATVIQNVDQAPRTSGWYLDVHRVIGSGPAERPADPLLRADHLREHREIGVDVVAPSSAISDDPESFRAGLIRFFRPWA